MPDDVSYVFYHAQSEDSLREGDDEEYLAHSILPHHRERVMHILHEFGYDWNGEDNSAMCVPFNNFTPEQMLERNEEERKRQERIAEYNALETDMGLRPYDSIDDLLTILGDWCIRKNLYRKSNEFHNFTDKEIFVINRNSRCIFEGKRTIIQGGYVFLDDENGTEGMIRLYIDDANPKWSFWKEGDKMMVDMA